MNTQKATYLVIILAAIIAIGYITNKPSPVVNDPALMNTQAMPAEQATESNQEKELNDTLDNTTAEPQMNEVSSEDMGNQETLSTTPIAGTYEDYNPEAVANSDADRIFLSFHATWCPSCRALEADIEANDIPADVAIFKVNYDTATELKRIYGVTVQHSIIEIRADGTAVGSIAHPPILTALLGT